MIWTLPILNYVNLLLESVLRGIEFIYKEPGVNRPLRVNEDNPHDNLNHTIYRNQVNKVANAIKEIITAIEPQEQKPEAVSKEIIKPISALRKNQITTIYCRINHCAGVDNSWLVLYSKAV